MGRDVRLLFLLVCCLLVTASGDQCKQHEALARTPPLECITLRDVCIDQQHFVTYAPEHQPWQADSPLPSLSIKDLTYNWPNPKGNGDRYVRGWNLHYAPITIRPNSSEEACWDTQHPSFDPCNVPLIMWSRWPYNLAEAYGTVYAKLWLTAKAGALPAELLPVLATPHGLRAPKHMATFLGGLFTRPLTTLAQLSARRVGSGCEDAGQAGAGLQQQQQQQQQAAAQGAEGSVGRVGRCFATAHLCKFRNRDVTSLVAAARDLQAHYAPQVAELLQSEAQATRSSGSGSGSTAGDGDGSSHGASDTAWDGAGEGVLRVVFAVRPGMDARSLLNVEELLQQCNAWMPEVPAHLPTSTLPQGSGDDRSFGASDSAEGSENGARALRGAKPHVQRRLADPTVQEAANGHAGAMSGEPAAAAAQGRSHDRRQAAASPAGTQRRWHSAKCVGRVFGSGPSALLRDMGFMAHADVLVCIHGAACVNAYFMPNRSSLIEARPLGMNRLWAGEYFFKPIAWEQALYWYGIDIHNASNSKPSLLEEEGSDVLNKQVRARERHVRLPWPALRHHLDLIAYVGGDPERYREAYHSGAMYISDTMERLHVRLKFPEGVGWD